MRLFLLCISLCLAVMPTLAQDAPVELIRAETEAADGVTLVGDFYLVNPERPTIILLHELYTTRAMWEPVARVLSEHGYNALAVDLRGFGQTRAVINWQRAVEDVATWFTWLRDVGGVRGDAISTMGSSMGSTLAIIGCANDTACRTVIAISPGWSYYGISVEAAFADTLGERPVLLAYAENDRWPALGVPRIMAVASDQVVEQVYPYNTHGRRLIIREQAHFAPLMLDWLAEYAG